MYSSIRTVTISRGKEVYQQEYSAYVLLLLPLVFTLSLQYFLLLRPTLYASPFG